MPAFLNLSKLVSAPNAAMDMVRRKVSSWLIQSTMLSGSKSRELNPITTRKRMANHGMLILGLLVSAFSRLSLQFPSPYGFFNPLHRLIAYCREKSSKVLTRLSVSCTSRSEGKA